MPETIKKQHDIDAVVIGGVGFDPDDYDFRTIKVNTPYGIVKVKTGNVPHRSRRVKLALIQRHANDNTSSGAEHLPPHMLNYRANVWAAKSLGANRVIATNSVGTMRSHPAGSFLVANDFIDLTRSRVNTFYDNRTVHIDMTEPYCPEISTSLLSSLENNHMEPFRGVYVCTEGPRFETAAEIRMLGTFGDVVGMTGLPEVVLARELGLCYASLCIITNRACGLAGKKLTADEVLEMLEIKQETLRTILLDGIISLPARSNCGCKDAIKGATI
jgi:5'-methylthioadenosine phosphorylase